MDSPDQIMSSAQAVLQRRQAERNGPVELPSFRRYRAAVRRVTRAAIAAGAVLFAAMLVGLFVAPIGLFGLLLAVGLALVAAGAFLLRPAERPVRVEKLATSDIRALPAQAERWLQQQRPALPAPAARLADAIGARLETLSPQLARVPADSPEAGELRTLVGEQLPAFLADYARVPAALRTQARNGRTPDAQLVEGLGVIEAEIAQMTERLAAADLDQLSTRGRFLEMRYKDDETK